MNIFKEGKSGIKRYIIAAVIGIVMTLLLMLAFSVITYFFDLEKISISVLSTVSCGVGAFFAALYLGKSIKEKGIVIGLATGLIAFALVTVISLAVSKSGITLNTLFHFVIIMLFSLLGAVLGVNVSQNKKYI